MGEGQGAGMRQACPLPPPHGRARSPLSYFPCPLLFLGFSGGTPRVPGSVPRVSCGRIASLRPTSPRPLSIPPPPHSTPIRQKGTPAAVYQKGPRDNGLLTRRAAWGPLPWTRGHSRRFLSSNLSAANFCLCDHKQVVHDPSLCRRFLCKQSWDPRFPLQTVVGRSKLARLYEKILSILMSSSLGEVI